MKIIEFLSCSAGKISELQNICGDSQKLYNNLGYKGNAMPSITLAVTTPVIRQVNEGNEYQKQLAIRDASPDLRALIDMANAENKVSVAVCGVFELAVGDTGAIWGVHQDLGVQADDFSNIYSLLARRPDISVKFRW